MSHPIDPGAHAPALVLAALAADLHLHPAGLAHIALPGRGPVLPSSFPVASAAQAALGAVAWAAADLQHQRSSQWPSAHVDRTHAAVECVGHFLVDGVAPPLWDPLSGLYRCGDAVGAPGWVRLHANFAHHRDRALALLGCPPGDTTPRDAVASALQRWRAVDFEDACAQAGAVAAAARRFDEWDAHPHRAAVVTQPLIAIERVGDAPPRNAPVWRPGAGPLQSLRVIEMTRILAGPIAGRNLADLGADVLLLNSPHLPNISALPDTSRGKRSAHLDLGTDAGRQRLRHLLGDAHVMLQSYRPGALAHRGFGLHEVVAARPGIVHASLSAYGSAGPWAPRRGFDSLVQTATGFNLAEAEAAGSDQPKAMPLQILDHAAGLLLAAGTIAALGRQQREGGSWSVQVSLARVAHWLRGMGRIPQGLLATPPDPAPWMDRAPSRFGELQFVRSAISWATPFARRAHPPADLSQRPGDSAAVWLADD